MKDEIKARLEAEQHWEFLERWLHMVYVDSFIHGWKHGEEEDKEADDGWEDAKKEAFDV